MRVDVTGVNGMQVMFLVNDENGRLTSTVKEIEFGDDQIVLKAKQPCPFSFWAHGAVRVCTVHRMPIPVQSYKRHLGNVMWDGALMSWGNVVNLLWYLRRMVAADGTNYWILETAEPRLFSKWTTGKEIKENDLWTTK